MATRETVVARFDDAALAVSSKDRVPAKLWEASGRALDASMHHQDGADPDVFENNLRALAAYTNRRGF